MPASDQKRKGSERANVVRFAPQKRTSDLRVGWLSDRDNKGPAFFLGGRARGVSTFAECRSRGWLISRARQVRRYHWLRRAGALLLCRAFLVCAVGPACAQRICDALNSNVFGIGPQEIAVITRGSYPAYCRLRRPRKIETMSWSFQIRGQDEH